MKRSLIAFVMAALGFVAPAFAAEIALRPAVRAVADRALTLADVADLSGAEAETLAGVVVHAGLGAGERGVVQMRDVRAALDAHGVNWGKVSVRGSECELVVAAAPKAERPAPVAPQEPPPKHETIRDTGSSTVRTAVAGTLANLFGVTLEDLQIAFDDADGALLATGGEGRRIEVQPAASPSASRIPLNVWIYEGDRVVASGQIRADVRVRRDAVIAMAGLRRGQTISAGDVTLETMWTEPSAGAPIASLDEAVGQVCRTRVPAGTALRADHVERAMVVKRGDLVTVHCVSGGIVVKAPARAQSDGRDGEVIEFKLDKSKRPFLARISGAGRAVMVSGSEAGATEDRP